MTGQTRPGPRLTAAARALLKLLQFRDDLGPMWLVPTGRGRLVLVAHTMIPGRPPARAAATSRPTVDALRDCDLLMLDDTREEVTFTGRTALDGDSGYRVELTEAGRVWRRS